MTYFLDTNTCIYFLNGSYPTVRERLLSHRPAEIAIPAIVKAELLYGAYKSMRSDENEQAVVRFLLPYTIAGFSDSEAKHYALIRADLEKTGTPIGPNDMIVASIVRANNGILITHNVSEFRRVTDLRLEDWSSD